MRGSSQLSSGSSQLSSTRALLCVSTLKMDYKRRLSLSSSPEAQGLLNAFNDKAMIGD